MSIGRNDDRNFRAFNEETIKIPQKCWRTDEGKCSRSHDYVISIILESGGKDKL